KSSTSSNAFSQCKLLINVQFSEANSRLNPGAIFCPINAASIGIVPEPQNGSIKVCSGFQFVNITSAAAIVSLIGASPCPTLYPLLCRPAPDVSMLTLLYPYVRLLQLYTTGLFQAFSMQGRI